MNTLNETNCKEYTDAELEIKIVEVASEQLKKELKKIYIELKKIGWKSEQGKELAKKEVEIKANFIENYGKDALLKVLIGKTSSTGKLLNSKGNGFGNF